MAAVSPIELVRTRMQYHGANGTISSVSSVLHESIKRHGGLLNGGGVKVLWQGLMPTLCRDVPFSALYWTCIECFKHRLKVFYRLTDTRTPWEEFKLAFTAGVGAGCIAATLTTPFDVAKTRRQVWHSAQPQADITPYSLRAQLKAIWASEGWSGLFKGVIPRVAKVAPACAIMLSSYEVSKMYFARIV